MSEISGAGDLRKPEEIINFSLDGERTLTYTSDTKINFNKYESRDQHKNSHFSKQGNS